MTDHEKFELCLGAAEDITRAYRLEYRAAGDPQCAITTATALIIVAIVAAAGSIAGGVVSSMGYAQAAKAAKDSAKFNEAVAANNAAAARQQAALDAQRIRDKNRRVLASQRAAWAKSGIDPDSGTAADVSADSAVQGEWDALMALYTGATGAQAYHLHGQSERMRGKAAMGALPYQQASSILGGVSGGAGILASAGANYGGSAKSKTSNPKF
jgi:hypothetical protein